MLMNNVWAVFLVCKSHSSVFGSKFIGVSIVDSLNHTVIRRRAGGSSGGHLSTPCALRGDPRGAKHSGVIISNSVRNLPFKRAEGQRTLRTTLIRCTMLETFAVVG